MADKLTPGQTVRVIRKGTFTAPHDIPLDKIKALIPTQWGRIWVENQEKHGYRLASPIQLTKDPGFEIGDALLGTSDTLRYRYCMSAYFETSAATRTLEVPDHIADKMVARGWKRLDGRMI